MRQATWAITLPSTPSYVPSPSLSLYMSRSYLPPACLVWYLLTEEIKAMLQPWEEDAVAKSYSLAIKGQPFIECNRR